MSESESIHATVDKETQNYTVYESADGDTLVGTYVSDEAAEQVGEFAEFRIGEDEQVELSKKKDTGNYGVYEAPPAITGMYVSHDVLGSEEDEDGNLVAPESVNVTLAASDEETFESAIPSEEDEEEASDEEDEDATDPTALVAGAAGESESESDESDEEVEVSDEEIGLDE